MNKSREEEEPKINDQEEHAGQKRKHPSSDAKEFQGSNSKETVVIDISDDDDDEVEFSAMFSFILWAWCAPNSMYFDGSCIVIYNLEW